jgi:hypothetical protein
MSKLLNKDFTHSIDVNYNYEYSCEDSGCDVEGICRCGTIYDECIRSVEVDVIVGDIYSEYFDNSISTMRDNSINSILFGITKEIDLYTIDRILRHFKIWETHNWEIEIDGGYYGQEMNGVIMKKELAEKIEFHLDTAFSIDDLSGRIEYLLGLEYGHLLPSLAGCKYEVIEVNKEDIIFGSDGHYEKVKYKKLNHYLDPKYHGIRGVVILKERKSGDKWRLIDGYHRCTSTQKDKVKVLKAYS